MIIETRRKPKEILPPPPAHWVRFRDITYEDVAALLGIFKDKTGKTPFPIGEEDYERLRREFLGGAGYVERRISKGSCLEWRRLETPKRTFIRFKISGVDKLNPIKPEEDTIQTRIDNYFLGQNKAILASKIYSPWVS